MGRFIYSYNKARDLIVVYDFEKDRERIIWSNCSSYGINVWMDNYLDREYFEKAIHLNILDEFDTLDNPLEVLYGR